jgi:hypothetical protein
MLRHVKMSLSPRPQRFITMRWSCGFSGRELDHLGERVRGLERRDDAFELEQSWKAASASSSVADR